MNIDPDFTPVPVRARRDGWTPARQAAFIVALAHRRNIVAAARSVGLSCQSAYRLRDRPDAAGFAAAWHRALATPPACPPGLGRAMDGVATPITYRGRQVGERRRYDNRLAMYLLRIRRPERFGLAQEQKAVVSRDSATAFADALARLTADLAAGTAPHDGTRDGTDSPRDVARGSSPSAPPRLAGGDVTERRHDPPPPPAPSASVHPRVRRGP